ncbi:alpha/beta-hydrolase [Fomitiporia mediterranea MF3/22]|uniref:alpha/beta-hydrolase n=1 Tax=Fomitiporia mediterranea (strain MF3/22) TaxID=694068 RepID=UPI0004409450|nr:alpha/beta-hydrolase [Fomitiporia mediterranea MF3/22]EJD01881.1 alpha/beta-hydrolase [Fomitiporia mediterranea MF3/22]
MLQLTSRSLPWIRRKRQHDHELQEADIITYKLEKVPNFRWVAKHFGKRSEVTLSSKDLVSNTLQNEISKIGQFAEVAYGAYDANLVWRYLEELSKPDFPFELHDALRSAKLMHVLRGRYSDVQGLIALREKEKQLVVAFSGTCNISQALHDINALRSKYSPCRKSRFGMVKVHAGFWRLYRGIRRTTLENLQNCLQLCSEKELPIEEIVVTGHSLGGALALLFIMDLLNEDFYSKYLAGKKLLREGWRVSLVIFGAPRVGNAAFAELYRDSTARFREKHGEDQLCEYSVKAYNDGVTALPSLGLGYRHALISVLYLYRGCLYHTPASEYECSKFNVAHDKDSHTDLSPQFPLGGHNYYNGRDLEKTVRRMAWIAKARKKDLDESWKERYMKEVEQEKRKLNRH